MVGDYVGKKSTASKNKYNAKAYDRINIIVKKGDRPQVNDLTALQKRFGKDRVLLLSA